MRESDVSPDDPVVAGSAKPSKTLNSSSELSLLFPLKQLQRLRPHLAADCFSLLPSMKFWTILARQTELGSNSLAAPSLLYCASPPMAFSAVEVLRTPGNCRSKSRLSLDLRTGLDESVRAGSDRTCGGSMSTGWILGGIAEPRVGDRDPVFHYTPKLQINCRLSLFDVTGAQFLRAQTFGFKPNSD